MSVRRKITGRGGLKFTKTCKCGNYQPKSVKGLINLACRNCGGRKKVKMCK